MFTKVVENVAIRPYDTRTDYPHTSFPDGVDYPEFNIYWVHPTIPNYDPMTETIIESDHVFNTELNRWEQGWEIANLTPEETSNRQATIYFSSLNWNDFLSTCLTSPIFDQLNEWAGNESPSYKKIQNNLQYLYGTITNSTLDSSTRESLLKRQLTAVKIAMSDYSLIFTESQQTELDDLLILLGVDWEWAEI